MLTKLLTLTFIFALLLTQPPTLLAQDSKGQQDWSTVQAVPVGSKLRIESKSGKDIEGTLSDVSDSALTLTRKGKNMSFNRTEIRRIYRLASGSRAKSTLIGTGIGAGIGGGLALAALGVTHGSDYASQVIAKGVGLGAGLGAALGVLIGKGNKRTLIYELK